MTIDRDFKLFKAQIPSLVRGQVESQLLGLRNQLAQTIEAAVASMAPPAPPPATDHQPAINALIEQLTILTQRVDAIDHKLARYIESDKHTLTRATVIEILKAEFPEGLS